MKILVRRCLVGFFFVGSASLAFAGPFKSRVITGSPLEITVAQDQFFGSGILRKSEAPIAA